MTASSVEVPPPPRNVSLPVLSITVSKPENTTEPFSLEFYSCDGVIYATVVAEDAAAGGPLLARFPVDPLGGGGAIVNVSSLSSFIGFEDHASYCASKGALDAMSRVMTNELGRHGIRVNCIMPGAVPTEIMMKALRLEDDDLPKLEKMLRLPMRRLGTPEDLGQAVLYFVSPASSWVTGQVIGIDGGL